MTEQLTEEQIAEYKEHFSSLDVDGDGQITAEEFGFPPTEKEVEEGEDFGKSFIARFDIDGNGTIDFSEFVVMMVHIRKEKDVKSSNENSTRILREFFNKNFESEIFYNGSALELYTIGELLHDPKYKQTCDENRMTAVKEIIAAIDLDFSTFDVDGDGFITASEVKQTLMHDSGTEMTDAEIDVMFRVADVDEDGVVNYDDFLKVRTRKYSPIIPTEAEIRSSFEKFDVDGNGFITASELKQSMHDLVKGKNDAEIDAMVRDADLDVDGQVSYDEYSKMMNYMK